LSASHPIRLLASAGNVAAEFAALKWDYLRSCMNFPALLDEARPVPEADGIIPALLVFDKQTIRRAYHIINFRQKVFDKLEYMFYNSIVVIILLAELCCCFDFTYPAWALSSVECIRRTPWNSSLPGTLAPAMDILNGPSKISAYPVSSVVALAF
jgi:hypothetical protein